MTKEEKRKEWEQRIAELEASGKSVHAFCIENAVQTPNFGHYAAITSGFKSFLMIALWYSLGGLSLRLP
jgi:hypothetical protein